MTGRTGLILSRRTVDKLVAASTAATYCRAASGRTPWTPPGPDGGNRREIQAGRQWTCSGRPYRPVSGEYERTTEPVSPR